MESLIHFVDELKSEYGVDARIFLAIYVVKVVLFWIVFACIVRALRARDWGRFTSWCLLAIVIFLAPYTYAYFAGNNLPPWCSWVYCGLVVLAVVIIAWKIRLAMSRKRVS